MTFHGHVENGVIVVDDSVQLPEGAEVRFQLVHDEAIRDEHGQTLGEKLMKFAGRAVGLPPDAAGNHDRYLYETRGE